MGICWQADRCLVRSAARPEARRCGWPALAAGFMGARVAKPPGHGEYAASVAIDPHELHYDYLRQRARALLRGSRGLVDGTELVHECYLRMQRALEQGQLDQEGYRSYAARTLQAAMVDHVRREARLCRGGGQLRITLDESIAAEQDDQSVDLLDLDVALSKLTAQHPQVAQVVQLRYFGGLTEDQVAAELGVVRRTVAYYWQFGRAWLRRELGHGAEQR